MPDFTASEIDHSSKSKTYKILGLALLSLAVLAADWWLINTSLYGSKPLEHWLGVAALSLVWISFFSFFVIANNDRRIFAGIILAGLLGYLAIMPQDKFVWIGGLLFAALCFMFRSRMKSLEKHQSHFSLRHLVGGSIIILTYAFLLLLGFNIYYNTSQDFKRNPELFYEKLGESAAKSFKFSSVLPAENFSLDQSLDDFLLKNIPPEAQGSIDLAATRNEFLKRFSIVAKGDEPLADIFARVATDRIKNSASQYEKFFPLIFTLIILGLLRTFAFVFYWLGILVSWLMYKLLLMAGFFRIAKVQVEVDKLEI